MKNKGVKRLDLSSKLTILLILFTVLYLGQKLLEYQVRVDEYNKFVVERADNLLYKDKVRYGEMLDSDEVLDCKYCLINIGRLQLLNELEYCGYEKEIETPELAIYVRDGVVLEVDFREESSNMLVVSKYREGYGLNTDLAYVINFNR